MDLTEKQKEAVALCVSQRNAFVWWKPGEGKTRIALAYFAEIAKRDKEKSGDFLVVCRRIAFEDWREEARKIGLDWRIMESEDGCFLPWRGWRIVLVSHGLLARRDWFAQRPWKAVAFDEGFLFKNPKASRTRMAGAIATRSDYGSIILSGSIMTAKDPTDVYGQAIAIGLNDLIARNLTEFRGWYMNQIGMGSYRVYVPRKDSYKKIARKISHHAHTYFPEGRPTKHITRFVDLQSLQIKMIEQLKEEYYLEYEDKELDIKNALSLAVKIQQISNGHVRIDEEIKRFESGKLEYCKSIVEELLAAGERVVVWTAFREDVARLHSFFPSGRTLLGGCGGMPDISNSDSLVLATQAMGSSINALKDFRYAIYFSTNHKWLDMDQSRGRTERKSSNHDGAVYYYLLSKGSLDETVLLNATSSGKSEEELKNHIKSWLDTK